MDDEFIQKFLAGQEAQSFRVKSWLG